VHDVRISHFLGFWSTLTTALFSYIGTELIGVTVGEAENPRKNVPKAIRRMFFRILVFYVGGTFVISLMVPSNSSVRPTTCQKEAIHDLASGTFCG
jgi:amino acid transporter